MTEARTIRLDSHTLETMRRLMAEWENARLRTELARQQIERAVGAVVQQHGLRGTATLSVDDGVLTINPTE